MAKAKKPLFEKQGAWAAGLSTHPVFIDGLSHELFYLIAATKTSADDYQAIVIGKFGQDSYKVKMYGKFEDWGFTKAGLEDKYDARDFLSRHKESAGYQRYYTSRKGVEKLLAALEQTRNVTVCPAEGVQSAFEMPRALRAKVASALHPTRGGKRPQLPFTPPVALPNFTAGAVAA
jgi:hypothetical protein